MASLLNMSGGGLLKKGLPYDAEIEYLESTGTQWIDTGVIPRANIGASAKFWLNDTNNSNYIFGSRANGTQRFYLYNNEHSNKIIYGYGDFITTGVNVITKKIVIASLNFYNDRTYKINGEVVDNLNYISFSQNFPMYLFASNFAGSPLIETLSCLRGRIYSCQVTDGNTLAHDFIPVRVGNVGYMYDKVSGTLFGNQGTGNFILGNDI